MADLAIRLIRIKTINPPGTDYKQILDLLEEECNKLGMSCTRYPVPEATHENANPENMIARLDLGRKKTIHFNGHIDVVPANDSWIEAFDPVLDGDRIYGRGSADMKSGHVCYLYALKALIRSGITIPNNIEFSFVCDEETGGKQGMGTIAGTIDPDLAIGEGAMGEWVSIGNKGILWFRITITGKAAHAAYAHKGVNAFELMTLLATELIDLKKKIQSRTSRFPTETPEEGHASMTIGDESCGGNKTNTVPQQASFTIDRRVLPDEDFNQAKQEIIGCVERFATAHPEALIEISVTAEDPAVAIDPQSSHCINILSAISEVIGKQAKPKITPGGTDLRYLIARGIPSFGYAAYGENLHADHEWVSLSSMIATAKIYARIMAKEMDTECFLRD